MSKSKKALWFGVDWGRAGHGHLCKPQVPCWWSRGSASSRAPLPLAAFGLRSCPGEPLARTPRCWGCAGEPVPRRGASRRAGAPGTQASAVGWVLLGAREPVVRAGGFPSRSSVLIIAADNDRY